MNCTSADILSDMISIFILGKVRANRDELKIKSKVGI
jgi:hypothetical protein